MEVYVFDKSLNPLGLLNSVSDLMWETVCIDKGSFELWCALTEDNIELLQEDRILSVDDEPESAGFIELVNFSTGSDGLKKLHVAGKTCEGYLEFRSVFPVFIKSGTVSSVVYDLLDKHVINPTDPLRAIPIIHFPETLNSVGPSITYQNTGDTVLDQLYSLCGANALRFRLKFLRDQKKLEFELSATKNRTIDQQVNSPVYISSELDDILDSEYTKNKSNYRNVAIVAGEDSSTERKIVQVGSLSLSGVDRREVFVDARDLQSETDDGIATEAQYNSMLSERGLSKLEDYKSVETFDATIRSYDSSYEYGTDFNLGDIITVYDARIKVRVDAIVYSTTLEYSSTGKRREFTFGYSQPTIQKKINRR